MSNIWQQFNNAAADVVATVRESVVQVHSEGDGIGAGTIWHADGLIVTNAHVIAGGNQLRRNLKIELSNGDLYPANVLAFDLQTDIAALAIDATNLPPIRIGHSSGLRPGQYLLALGHPWGILDAVTGGVVIGKGHNLPEQADGRPWIALDMKMRPGHSGGPLFDFDGAIVGVNTMIRGPEVSFAVPIDVVKQFLKDTIGKAVDTIPDAASYTETSDTPLV